MTANDPRDRLIVALDTPTGAEALRLVDTLSGAAGWFKIGSQLFTGEGPDIVRAVKARGVKVFLDLKFHDIPATVALASRAAVSIGVDMFNVHALGGEKMMRTACESVTEHCAELGVEKPAMIAVTVLTSMGAEDLDGVGIHTSPLETVTSLAALADKAGLDGVVASAGEAPEIKRRMGEGFTVVTPGVRPAWAAADDQKRVKTPAEAIERGADYLVVGRPITKAEDPLRAAQRTVEEIESAL